MSESKKGEKVDFAIKIDGKISMLVEVKPISSKLGDTQFSQLFRYFHVTEARLAILTNGHEVWFFADTDEPNKMDKKPFFTFNLQDHDKSHVTELARFRKGSFAIELDHRGGIEPQIHPRRRRLSQAPDRRP